VSSPGPWLWLGDPRDAVELAPGDLVLVVGGPDHHIAHERGAACLSPERFREQHADAEHAHEHDDHRGATVFLCGAYRFSGDVGRGLIQTLPPILLLSAAAHDPLHDVVVLLSRELSGPAPGQQTILDRLLDVLLVLAMRACFERSPAAPRWYQAFTDPRLRPALAVSSTQVAARNSNSAVRAWLDPNGNSGSAYSLHAGGPLITFVGLEALKDSACLWARMRSGWPLSAIMVCLSPTAGGCMSVWMGLSIRVTTRPIRRSNSYSEH
jgi:Cupin